MALADLAREAGQGALTLAARQLDPQNAVESEAIERKLLVDLALLQAWVDEASSGPMARRNPTLKPARGLLAALLDATAVARALGGRVERGTSRPDAVHWRTLLSACAETLDECTAAVAGDAAARAAALDGLEFCVKLIHERDESLARPLITLQEALSYVYGGYAELDAVAPHDRVYPSRLTPGPARRRANVSRAMLKEIGAIAARAGDPRADRHLVRLRQLALELLAHARDGDPASSQGALEALMLGQALGRVGGLIVSLDVTTPAYLATQAALRELREPGRTPDFLRAHLIQAVHRIESSMALSPGAIVDLRELASSLRDAASCLAKRPGFFA